MPHMPKTANASLTQRFVVRKKPESPTERAMLMIAVHFIRVVSPYSR